VEALNEAAVKIMSRLEWLQMKRTCASYGPPLTPYEGLELLRLESDSRELCGHRVLATEDDGVSTWPAVEWSVTPH
jgi:hypothetical protein